MDDIRIAFFQRLVEFKSGEMTKPVDIFKMTVPELEMHSAQVQRRIAELKLKTKQELLEIFRQRAAQDGYSLEEIVEAAPRRTSKSYGPKYINPERPHEEWVGRGRRPKWIHEALNRGLTLEDLRIRRD